MLSNYLLNISAHIHRFVLSRHWSEEFIGFVLVNAETNYYSQCWEQTTVSSQPSLRYQYKPPARFGDCLGGVDRKAEDGEEWCEKLGFGHDMADEHMHLQKLWLSIQDLLKIKFLAWSAERFLRPHSWLRAYWQLLADWEIELFFFSSGTLKASQFPSKWIHTMLKAAVLDLVGYINKI